MLRVDFADNDKPVPATGGPGVDTGTPITPPPVYPPPPYGAYPSVPGNAAPPGYSSYPGSVPQPFYPPGLPANRQVPRGFIPRDRAAPLGIFSCLQFINLQTRMLNRIHQRMFNLVFLLIQEHQFQYPHLAFLQYLALILKYHWPLSPLLIFKKPLKRFLSHK